MIEVSHKEMYQMFTTNNIAVFQQNLIDNEIEAARPQKKAELISVMKTEKISKKKLVDMVATLHTLMSSTELTLVEIFDTISDISPSDDRATEIWEHLKYGAPI
jgi:hypothetical protein